MNGFELKHSDKWELRRNNGLIGRFELKQSAETVAQELAPILSRRGRVWRTQEALAVVKQHGGEVR